MLRRAGGPRPPAPTRAVLGQRRRVMEAIDQPLIEHLAHEAANRVALPSRSRRGGVEGEQKADLNLDADLGRRNGPGRFPLQDFGNGIPELAALSAIELRRADRLNVLGRQSRVKSHYQQVAGCQRISCLLEQLADV